MHHRMFKLLAPIGALLFLAATAVPAQAATIYAEHCRVVDGLFVAPSTQFHGKVCVWAEYNNQAGPDGITIVQTGAYIDTDVSNTVTWENGDPAAISGTSLLIKNENGTVQWSKTGSAVTQTNSHDPLQFFPQLSMPHTNSVLIQYTGYWRYDKQPDPGDTTVALTIND